MIAVSVLSVAIGFIFFDQGLEGKTIGLFITSKNYLYWILLFYIPLFFVRRYLANNMVWVFVHLFVIVGLAYYFFPYKYETGIKGMWGSQFHDYKWFWYFVVMFFGAFVGKNKDKIKLNPIKDFVLCLSCFIGFYSLPAFSKNYLVIAPFQILMLPLLMFFVYYLYKFLSSSHFLMIYQKPKWHFLINVLGGLCLESYLVHKSLFTTSLNGIFPLNLIIIYITVLLTSYVVRSISRIILQTFRKEDYNWKAVFSVTQ